MSITVQQRDFTAPLDSEIQELLDAISDFEFSLPEVCRNIREHPLDRSIPQGKIQDLA